MSKSREKVELMAEMSECPLCGSPLAMYWSSCHDPECCGIDDRIECERCDWEKEGYFDDLDAADFKELVPRKIDEDKRQFNLLKQELDKSRKQNMSESDLKWQIKVLRDRIVQLQSEIKIFEERFGCL